ncbi:hypothetical protein [Streptodolium elevatio]|uniref:Uncharacterized protein n=1 Tax=Streptodolium elevatio TaxID=3157996 RepID=A0ABV3DAV0_9ACTN
MTAARGGDLDQAVMYGEWALKNVRRSLPSLLMISRELAMEVRTRFSGSAQARDYLEYLDSLTRRR